MKQNLMMLSYLFIVPPSFFSTVFIDFKVVIICMQNNMQDLIDALSNEAWME